MQRCVGMNSTQIRANGRAGRNQQVHNRIAREEIRNFLLALNTYPESFSRRPGISFAQHHRLITTSAKAPAQRIALG